MFDMELCFVYKILNKMNGKIYFGISKKPSRRFKYHGYSKYPIGKAIRKYGKDCFSLELIYCGTRVECAAMEISLITYYNTRSRENGYNVAIGGERPPVMKGNNHPSYGKKRSPETIEKIKKKRALQITTDETRDKMKTNMSGNRHAKRSFDDAVARLIWTCKFTKSTSELSKKYNVDRDIITCIWRGERYKFVQIDDDFDDGIDTSQYLKHSKPAGLLKNMYVGRDIWLSRNSGMNTKEVASKYNVSKYTVENIWSGKFYKMVQDDEFFNK